MKKTISWANVNFDDEFGDEISVSKLELKDCDRVKDLIMKTVHIMLRDYYRVFGPYDGPETVLLPLRYWLILDRLTKSMSADPMLREIRDGKIFGVSFSAYMGDVISLVPDQRDIIRAAHIESLSDE